MAFGLAASGRTPFVLAALNQARRQGAATLGLACASHPALSELVDVAIVVHTGPEVIAGSTRMKAGSAQKLVLTAFSTTLMVTVGRVYRNLMVDMRVSNEKLRQRAIRMVSETTGATADLAQHRLDESGWSIKTAILAIERRVSVGDATDRLAHHQGNLRQALESAAASS